MRILRPWLLSLALAVAFLQPAIAQQRAPASHEALAAARELIAASATAAQFDQLVPLLVRQVTQAFTALAPGRSDEIREVMEKLTSRFIERKAELIDQIVLIYADVMTVEDMREVAKFYQSGAGRRMIVAMPEITRRSSIAGQVWGQMLGQELSNEARVELKKRGIDL